MRRAVRVLIAALTVALACLLARPVAATPHAPEVAAWVVQTAAEAPAEQARPAPPSAPTAPRAAGPAERICSRRPTDPALPPGRPRYLVLCTLLR